MIEYEPVRLRDLIAEGKLLWLYCVGCGRERDVDPASLKLPLKLQCPESAV
jgi:hypothetical protein